MRRIQSFNTASVSRLLSVHLLHSLENWIVNELIAQTKRKEIEEEIAKRERMKERVCMYILSVCPAVWTTSQITSTETKLKRVC